MGTRKTGPSQTDMARALKGLTDGSLTLATLPAEIREGLLGLATDAQQAERDARKALREAMAARLGDALGALITDGTLGERQTFKSGAEGFSHSGVRITVDGTEYAVNVLIRDVATIPAKGD